MNMKQHRGPSYVTCVLRTIQPYYNRQTETQSNGRCVNPREWFACLWMESRKRVRISTHWQPQPANQPSCVDPDKGKTGYYQRRTTYKKRLTTLERQHSDSAKDQLHLFNMFVKELIFAIVIGVASAQFGNSFQRPSFFQNFGRPSQPTFRQPPSGFRSGPPSSSSSGSSNINYNGRTGQYHLSWRASGASPMSHSAARSYCQRLGMSIVSFDGSNGNAKAAEINSVVVGEAPYYWTGGRISGGG